MIDNENKEKWAISTVINFKERLSQQKIPSNLKPL